MKTLYDLSFLTSPRDPRQDNWIGQPFELSYLNSEPGTNFVFRYKPFGINLSRVEEQRSWADRMAERDSRKTNIRLLDRDSEWTNTIKDESLVFVCRQSVAAISQHGFMGRLQESIALIEAGKRLVKPDAEEFNVEGDLMVDKYVDEKYVNPIVGHLPIIGDRIEAVRDTIIQMYKLVQREHEKDTVLSLQQLFDRIDFEQGALNISKLMISSMNKIPEAITHALNFGQRTYEQESIVNSTPVMSGLMMIPSRINYPILSTRDADEDGIILNVTLGYRDPQFSSDVVKHKNARRQVADATVHGVYVNTFRDLSIAQEYPSLALATRDGLGDTTEYVVVSADKSHSKDGITIIDNSYAETLNTEAYLLTQKEFIDQLSNYETRINELDEKATHGINRDVYITSYMFVDRFIKSKEIHKIVYDLIDSGKSGESLLDLEDGVKAYWFPSEAIIEMVKTNVETSAMNALPYSESTKGTYLEKDAKTSSSDTKILFVDKSGNGDALISTTEVRADSKIQVDASIMDEITFAGLGSGSARIELNAESFAELMGSDSRIYKIPVSKVDPLITNSGESFVTDDFFYADALVQGDAKIHVVDTFVTSLPLDGINYDKFEKKVDKIEHEAWLIYALDLFTLEEKLTIIENNLKSSDAVAVEGLESTLVSSDKEERDSNVTDETGWAINNPIPSFTIEDVKSDLSKVDGYIRDMVALSDRSDEFQAIVQKLVSASEPERLGIIQKLLNASGKDREGIELKDMKPSEKDINLGIIQELINANDEAEKKREGFIPKHPFVLSQDGSDWEDIWNRYSPGVDILDPPDSDYDYSKLASTVYNLETGVPYAPLSPTNVSDVKIKTPLHHPLPENYDLGVDDTKEIIVDNYSFIDVTLAIESLKTRNKLRYAGMPAEKTMRELFSKLFTWIQQAAPDNPEYNRMFRFARWYAESATIQVSDHILHRIYNGWRSTIHSGGDLGIPYTQSGWHYYPTAFVIQSNSEYSKMAFEQENYIDGELIVRGYFDNPLSQGTMEIRVDDEVVDTIQVNGAFTRTIAIPQGKHTYEFIFDGSTGRVSISDIQVSGCVFVSASTTSDDTNSNGLKATTTLINMLLTYFERHHGSGKTKGTMAVKQRKVWQVQT